MVVAQLVIIVDESVGGAFFLQARYYESDGADRRLVADRRAVADLEDLDGLAGCLAAIQRL